MSERLVNEDHETPMLRPALKVNQRGSDSRQYPWRMMLALVIYCYANGQMLSRRMERATHRDLSVRSLTGETHPDDDIIRACRRFLELPQLAREMELRKVGTVSVDGSLGTVQRAVAAGAYAKAEQIGLAAMREKALAIRGTARLDTRQAKD